MCAQLHTPCYLSSKPIIACKLSMKSRARKDCMHNAQIHRSLIFGISRNQLVSSKIIFVFRDTMNHSDLLVTMQTDNNAGSRPNPIVAVCDGVDRVDCANNLTWARDLFTLAMYANLFGRCPASEALPLSLVVHTEVQCIILYPSYCTK